MSSTIERLDPELKIPFDEEAFLSGDPKRIADYMLELVKTLKELMEKMTKVANYGIDLNDGEALYIGMKQADGEYPIGAWRLIVVAQKLEIQEKTTSTGIETNDWTKIAGYSR